MRKSRIAIVLTGLTVLALAAGVAAGLLASRLPAAVGSTPTTAPAPLPPAIDRTPLVEELQLSPVQRDQMRTIWEAVRERVHQTFDDAQQLQKQRDDALVAMLSDEQKSQFEKISRDYSDRFAQLTRQREQMFQDAVRQTKELLSDEQRLKYDEILRTRVPPGSVAGGPGLGPPAPTIVLPATATTNKATTK